MAQEFTINSAAIESKINSLLPSQGGAGAGIDFSASTMIIPIIDLTETASGSALRQDLQTSVSFKSTAFSESASSSTLISNTGYWRIIGTSTVSYSANGVSSNTITINDGTTNKIIWSHNHYQSSVATGTTAVDIDLIVFLNAGDTCLVGSNRGTTIIAGSSRQIATIDGTLVNP